ncbi:MAG: NADH:flavin oxidoreductase [Atopobiaceae bacterium]|nr:NADH:flavin oxidoreductase [Atopobiaceae bacterium]
MTTELSCVQQPLSTGTLTFKNRIFMPAMATYVSSPEGETSDELLAHYEARVAGGNLSLVVTEHMFVHPRGRAKANQVSIANDGMTAGLTRLATHCKMGDTLAFAQISHAGAAAFRRIIGEEPWSASAISMGSLAKGLDGLGLGDTEPAHAVSDTEIAEIKEQFVAAAKRVKAAGFDGVELHSAHGYLLNQFYSPLTNHRTDAYGGSLEGRLRLLLEIIADVKAAVGQDYPVAVRLGGSDYLEGGSTIGDAVQASVLLEAAGICFIDLSGGLCRFTRPGHNEPGYFKDMSAAVKRAVSIPVLVAGGVTHIEQAQDLLEEEAADVIGIGRALLKNPNWANEAFFCLIEASTSHELLLALER